jgi:4-diphosphocytidyl-2-C-methyl-D-erythritol kinase
MLTLRSYAKINMHLRVGPRRPDGFHGIVSWFCSVGLADELEFTQVFTSATGTVTLTCDHPDVPCGRQNLILKAAESLGEAGRPPIHVHLRKRIPMGGGLGGGSSNAAAALRGLQRVWDIHLSPDREMEIAAQLGSDVPFFLRQPSAICRGRGEHITTIAPPLAPAALLLLPPIAMPTPGVYGKFDEMGLGTDLDSVERKLPGPELPTMDLLEQLSNDLETPAFSIAPELAMLRVRAEQILQRPVRMSGSGSTLFTLYESQRRADDAAAMLHQVVRIPCVACSLGRSTL